MAPGGSFRASGPRGLEAGRGGAGPGLPGRSAPPPASAGRRGGASRAARRKARGSVDRSGRAPPSDPCPRPRGPPTWLRQGKPRGFGQGALAPGLTGCVGCHMLKRDIRVKAVTSARKCQWAPWGTEGPRRAFFASVRQTGSAPSPAGVRLFTLRGARDVGEGLGTGDWKASRSPELSRGLPPPQGPPPGPVRGPVASCVSSSVTAAARPPARGKRKLH